MSVSKLAFICFTMLFTKITHALQASQFPQLRNNLSLHQKRGVRDLTSLLSSHLSKETMNSLTLRVEENNDLKNRSLKKDFALFTHDNVIVGYISKRGTDLLKNYPETFEITSKSSDNDDDVNISLNPDLTRMELADRSAAVEVVTKDLKEKKIITGR